MTITKHSLVQELCTDTQYMENTINAPFGACAVLPSAMPHTFDWVDDKKLQLLCNTQPSALMSAEFSSSWKLTLCNNTSVDYPRPFILLEQLCAVFALLDELAHSGVCLTHCPWTATSGL